MQTKCFPSLLVSVKSFQLCARCRDVRVKKLLTGIPFDAIHGHADHRTEADVRRYLTNPGDRSEESYVRRYDEDANSFPEG